MEKLCASFEDVVDINFVDVNKGTTSSFASMSMQAYLFRNKHLGFQFINHAPGYAMLRKGDIFLKNV